MNETETSYLSLDDVSVSFNEDPILNHISHRFEAGLHLITGSSGSGKTTLLRCINGVIPYFREAKLHGSIRCCGETFDNKDMAKRSQWVSSVFQNPKTQFFATDTTDELAFALESQALEPAEIRRRIDFYTKQMGTQELLNRNIFALSGGEKQLLAITSAAAAETPILLLDEPSASLDEDALMRLHDILLKLRDAGRCVIIADHRLFYCADIIDDICILEDGTLSCFQSSEISDNLTSRYHLRSLHKMRRDNLHDQWTKDKRGEWQKVPLFHTKDDASKRSEPLASAGLELRRYRFHYPRHSQLFNLDAYFAPGLNFLVGPNGIGKTSLIRCLCGLERAKGSQFFNGVLDKKCHQSALVMQDPNYQLFTDSIENEMRVVTKDQTLIQDSLKLVSLWERREDHPHVLSGGQKQRLILAQALASPKPIILLDEPTSGLCRKSMDATLKIINHMVTSGKLVIIITHDYELMTQTQKAHVVELIPESR